MINIGIRISKLFNLYNVDTLFALVTNKNKTYPYYFQYNNGKIYGFPCVLYKVADLKNKDIDGFLNNYINEYMLIETNVDRNEVINNFLKETIIDDIFYSLSFELDSLLTYKDYVSDIFVLSERAVCEWMISKKMISTV